MSHGQKRCYGLFEVEYLSNGKKKYHLIHADAYYLQAARRIFQQHLLAYAFGDCIRERVLRLVPSSRPAEHYPLEKPFGLQK